MLKRVERPDCSNNEKLRKGGVLLKKPRGSLIERSSPHYENLNRFEFSVNLSSKGKRDRERESLITHLFMSLDLDSF